MAATTSTPSAANLLDELDYAIAEHAGLTAGVYDGSDDSSACVLQDLRRTVIEMGDTPWEDIRLNVMHTKAPLPAWLPKSLTDALNLTGTISASQALAEAIRNPTHTDVPSLISAVQSATSQQGGSEHSLPPSERARPSGLTSAERIGGTSAPSSTTTLLTHAVAEPTVSPTVSQHEKPRHFHIGTRSRFWVPGVQLLGQSSS